MPEETITAPQSVAQERITITSDDGFPIRGTWQQREGGNTDSEVTREKEGGELFRDTVRAHPPTTDRMTLTRSYYRNRDIELYRWARQNASAAILTITHQPLTEKGAAYGKPIVERALLVGVNRPAYDANGTESQQIALMVEPFGDVA